MNPAEYCLNAYRERQEKAQAAWEEQVAARRRVEEETRVSLMNEARPTLAEIIPGADWEVLEASEHERLVVVRCVESPEIVLAVTLRGVPFPGAPGRPGGRRWLGPLAPLREVGQECGRHRLGSDRPELRHGGGAR